MSSLQDLQTKTWIIETSQGTDLVHGDRLVFANGRILKEWASAYTVKNDEITGRVGGLIFHIRPATSGQMVCTFTSDTTTSTTEPANSSRVASPTGGLGTADPFGTSHPTPCMTIRSDGTFVALAGNGDERPISHPTPTPVPTTAPQPIFGRRQ